MTKFPEYSKFHVSTNPQKSKLIEAFIRPGKILDIGCGNGLYALDCKPEENEIVQLDIIDRRSEIVNKYNFIQADVENYNLEDSSLNTIIAFDIIEHLNDDNSFIKKAYRQLKTGGRILISVPNEDNSLLETINLAHVHFTDKTHRREYSEVLLTELLKSNGFTVISILPHYNKAIQNFPDLFKKDNYISIAVAYILKCSVKLFCFIGIFRNKVIADWFIVAEKFD